jgi:hypothetical protein
MGDPACSPSLAIALSSMLNRPKTLPFPFMLGVSAIMDNRLAAWFLVERDEASMSP